MKKIVKLEQNNCRPCVMVGNFLDDLGVEYESINVHEKTDAAIKFGIMSTPVTILLDGETEIKRVAGFNPPELEDLVAKLNQ